MESTVSTLVEIACEAGVHDACGISANAEICGDKVLLEVVTTAKTTSSGIDDIWFQQHATIITVQLPQGKTQSLKSEPIAVKLRIQRKSIEALPLVFHHHISQLEESFRFWYTNLNSQDMYPWFLRCLFVVPGAPRLIYRPPSPTVAKWDHQEVHGSSADLANLV
ncbi:hypothetical protein Pst134EA_003362 [Puccinia striiformis f. sp. tritici]|uniref:Uncharacterized protein n=2 Tax=Puccinia striiformis TaxID=27350 RepID=A0A0L0VQS2_9BASI|nr:hypothetical protein Pst134EA_003362 [Puccinia striiformis f. sp. tritici]KAI9619890.1 hypothetical protein KEM48_008384 [Puccinia striiformis f. sp. tritici PST-130]KNF01619.1 hypothetical protein PSTG_05051 [Puccinia striiformis f. sp. tritici PST-78]POW16230.1 hypothetical protein PSTT_01397 [Puccinia striiformis]KAH9464929.1 hypothetical protein Pst134EB_004428 [Puccinia striiformis f. sp. tritici]KAH9472757.1 hypothetical protein Pst134EA_003362 [Puccinia striiformis f. sp. tritici]